MKERVNYQQKFFSKVNYSFKLLAITSFYRAQLIGSCGISSQWVCCSTFKYLVSICCSNMQNYS